MDKPVTMTVYLAYLALRHAGGSLRIPFMAALLVLAYLYAMNTVYAQDEITTLPDPTRPWRSDIAPPVPKTHKNETPPTLKLESTIVSGERRLAVIDGNTVSMGAVIKGFRIKEIFHYSVLLEKEGRTLTLKLFDEASVKTTGLGDASP